MRRLVLALMVLCFIPSIAYSAVVANRVSGSSITFDSNGNGVTFNSVTNHIIMWNESTTIDCYVDLKCFNSNGNGTGYFIRGNARVKIPASGKQSPNSVEFNFATKNLGFFSDSGSGTITYIVTGETGDL